MAQVGANSTRSPINMLLALLVIQIDSFSTVHENGHVEKRVCCLPGKHAMALHGARDFLGRPRRRSMAREIREDEFIVLRSELRQLA